MGKAQGSCELMERFGDALWAAPLTALGALLGDWMLETMDWLVGEE